MDGNPTRALASALALALIAFACAAPAGIAGRTAQAGAAPNALVGGINLSGAANRPLQAADQEVRQAKALGARIVRIEVPWSALEGGGPGQLEVNGLAYTDRVVNDAAADGIGVIILVDSTPCWASSAPESVRGGCAPSHRRAASSWPPSDPATAARFFAFLAQRYGSRLTALEVWNEPDQSNELYFAGPEKAVHYAALLRAAYTAIKSVAPSVQVLGGSLVGSNGVFLRALYAAGIKGYYDGLAVHFYTLTLAALRQFRQVQLANGDPSRLWLDEFGFPTCWPKQSAEQEIPCVTRSVQAADFTSIFHSISQQPYVAAVLPFKLADSTNEDFGVLSATGARKPSFAALRGVFASPFGSPPPVTLKLRRRGQRVLATGSGPVGDIMQLEALRGQTLRFRATFTLERFNRYTLALPPVIGTHGLRVRVFGLWSGPRKAAQKSL
jgi:hypothetical protein